MTLSLKTFIESLDRTRERRQLRETTHVEEATHAERLEHIALYARAGYFNMGYTVDAFQLPGDSSLH